MDIYIAENLKMLRAKFGYTLEAVSGIIDVSRQSVSKWESAETYPDIVNCLKLSNLYKVSLDELITKPMKLIEDNSFVSKDNQMFGMLDISDKGEVKLPESLLNLFDISAGDKLLLLADKKQGIALVKCSDLNEEDLYNGYTDSKT